MLQYYMYQFTHNVLYILEQTMLKYPETIHVNRALMIEFVCIRKIQSMFVVHWYSEQDQICICILCVAYFAKIASMHYSRA